MGRFVNPDNSAFQVALNSPIYVDKTGLLEYTNSVLNTTEAYMLTSHFFPTHTLLLAKTKGFKVFC